MSLLYVICAAIGGTVLVCQFLMSLVGLHGHGDMSSDVPDDVGADLGHDFDHELDHNVGHEGGGAGHAHPAAHDEHGSTSIFRVITVRTVVAALAFFGLTGMAATSANLSVPTALILALAAGGGAMYGVHWMMQQIYRLRQDGTVRIHRALGQAGTVYVKIPAREQGAGKVLLNLQDRTVELEAVTSGDEIPTGTQVVVRGMAGTEIVQVERLPTNDEVAHV